MINPAITETFYDNFTLRIKDFKCFLNKDEPDNHLIHPVNIITTLHQSIAPAEPSLPTLAFASDIPSMSMSLTAGQTQLLLDLIDGVMEAFGPPESEIVIDTNDGATNEALIDANKVAQDVISFIWG